jgi:hypothetical protein
MRQGNPHMLPLCQVSTNDYVIAAELTRANAGVIEIANIGDQMRLVTRPPLQARSEDGTPPLWTSRQMFGLLTFRPSCFLTRLCYSTA